MVFKDEKTELLITVNNNFEAEEIETYLHSFKIPVLKKYRDSGDYLKVYMGNTIYGIDIYVPSELFDKAREAIKVFNFPDVTSRIDDEMETLAKKRKRLQRIIAWIIVILFAPGVLWLVISLIIGIIGMML